MLRLVLIAALALPLAACGEREGTSVSIVSENGSAGITNGTAKIDVPGFKGEVRLPKFDISADNLDLNGVKLFPGSTVKSVNVDAGSGEGGKVRIAFDAPASAAAVRDYFRTELGKVRYSLSADGNGLTGTTDEGKPFRLTLGDAAGGKSSGEIALGG